VFSVHLDLYDPENPFCANSFSDRMFGPAESCVVLRRNGKYPHGMQDYSLNRQEAVELATALMQAVSAAAENDIKNMKKRIKDDFDSSVSSVNATATTE
jgi:hypothetical protein